jgi:hypothetical protein
MDNLVEQEKQEIRDITKVNIVEWKKEYVLKLLVVSGTL